MSDDPGFEPEIDPEADPVTPPEQDPTNLRKALVAERSARKGFEKALKEERFARLKAVNPWLDQKHLDGIGPDKWETHVQALTEIAKQIGGDKPQQAAEEASQPDKDVLAATASFVKDAGGVPSGPTGPSTTAAERMNQLARGDLNEAEWLTLAHQAHP